MSDTASDQPAAERTIPGPAIRHRPVWASALAAVSIVMGTLLVWQFLTSVILFLIRQSAVPWIQPSWLRWMRGLYVGMGVLLVVGGVLLLRRPAAGYVAHLIFAVLAVVAAAITVTALLYGEPPADLSTVYLRRQWAFHMPIWLMQFWLGPVAYALFLLFWLLRGKIRRQCRRPIRLEGPAGRSSMAAPAAGGLDLPPAGRPVWPAVVGTLAIALSVLDVINALLTAVPAMSILFTYNIRLTVSFLVVSAMEAAYAVTDLLLIVGGALLIRRRPAGILMIVATAWAVVGYVALQTVLHCLAMAGDRYALGDSLAFLILPRVLGQVLPRIAFSFLLVSWLGRSEVRRQAECWLAEGPAGVTPT